jgi:hypothetical protein
MFNTIVGAGAVGAGAASRYGSSSGQMMRFLAAPAPQHCEKVEAKYRKKCFEAKKSLRNNFKKLFEANISMQNYFKSVIFCFEAKSLNSEIAKKKSRRNDAK